MIDAREYSAQFPRRAVKEFKKGMDADGAGKRDQAIRHYQKAIILAPGFYVAHNNLGSDYLSKSDFPLHGRNSSGSSSSTRVMLRLLQSEQCVHAHRPAT